MRPTWTFLLLLRVHLTKQNNCDQQKRLGGDGEEGLEGHQVAEHDQLDAVLAGAQVEEGSAPVGALVFLRQLRDLQPCLISVRPVDHILSARLTGKRDLRQGDITIQPQRAAQKTRVLGHPVRSRSPKAAPRAPLTSERRVSACEQLHERARVLSEVHLREAAAKGPARPLLSALGPERLKLQRAGHRGQVSYEKSRLGFTF